jgi:hypothetical protein
MKSVSYTLYSFIAICIVVGIGIVHQWISLRPYVSSAAIGALLLFGVIYYYIENYSMTDKERFQSGTGSNEIVALENLLPSTLQQFVKQQTLLPQLPASFTFMRISNPLSQSEVLRQDVSLSSAESSVTLGLPMLRAGETYLFQVWLSYESAWNNCANPFRIMTLSQKSDDTSQTQDTWCDIPIAISHQTQHILDKRVWHLLQTIVPLPQSAESVVWKLGSTGGSQSTCNGTTYAAMPCVKSRGYWCGHRIVPYRPRLPELVVSVGLQMFFMPSIPNTLDKTTLYLKDASRTCTKSKSIQFDKEHPPRIQNQMVGGTDYAVEGLLFDTSSATGPPSYILSDSVSSPQEDHVIGAFTVCLVYKHRPHTQSQYIFKLFGEQTTGDITFNNALTCFISSKNTMCFVQGHDDADVLQFDIGTVSSTAMYTFVHSKNGDVQIYRNDERVVDVKQWFRVYTWGKHPMLINPKADVFPMQGTWSGMIGYNRALQSSDVKALKLYIFRMLNSTPQAPSIPIPYLPSSDAPVDNPIDAPIDPPIDAPIDPPIDAPIDPLTTDDPPSVTTKCRICFEKQKEPSFYTITNDKLEFIGKLTQKEKDTHYTAACPLQLFGSAAFACRASTDSKDDSDTENDNATHESVYQHENRALSRTKTVLNTPRCRKYQANPNSSGFNVCRCLPDDTGLSSFCGIVDDGEVHACNEMNCKQACQTNGNPNPFPMRTSLLKDEMAIYSSKSPVSFTTTAQLTHNEVDDMLVSSPKKMRDVFQVEPFNRE